LSVAAAGGIVTVQFALPPGFISGDSIVLTGASPSGFNGTFTISSANGNQIIFQNNAAPDGAAAGVTIQGYGTGKKYTDTILLPYVNSAYRGLQRALKAAGSTELKEASAFVEVPGLTFTDSSAQVFLSFEGLTIDSDADPAPEFSVPPLGQLPADLLTPVKVWERRSGSSDEFIPLVDLSETGGLPSRPQGSVLGIYEWAGDSLVFLGATQDNAIKLRYERSLPAVNDGAAQLFVLNSEDYHAFAVAATASASRGGREGQQWAANAEDCKENLIAAEVRRQQAVPRRRRAFSSRQGYTRRYY